MMVMDNIIEFIQDLVGENWTVKFVDERLYITAEDTTESRLDQEQLSRIKSMGFDFESILKTYSIVDVIFVPNGGGF